MKKFGKGADKLLKKWNPISESDYFDEFINFLNKHKLEYSETKKNDKTIEIDVTPFQSGVLDEEKEEFTGDILNKVFIDGYENLTNDEQKEFKNLYKKAYKQLKSLRDIEQELTQIQTKIDKSAAYLDMAENGEITTLGKQEYLDNAYNQYVETRSVSNPFLSQIQELEAKRNKLWLKAKKTTEDSQLIEQYEAQLSLLYEASGKWSIKDAVCNGETEETFEPTFELTTQFPSSESGTEDGTVNTSVGYNFKYSTNSIDLTSSGSLGLNLSETENGSILENSPVLEMENNYALNAGFNYTQGNFLSAQSISFSGTPSNQNLLLNSNFNYKNLGLQYQQTNSWTKDEETNNSNHYMSHNVSLAYNGFLNASGGAEITTDGQTYSLSLDKNIPIAQKDVFQLSTNLAFGSSYSTASQSVTINPQLGIQASYNTGNWNGSISLSDNYLRTMGQDGYRTNNNSFIMSSQTNYKNLGVGLSYSNIQSPGNVTNTYGFEISYQKNDNNIGLEYSISSISGSEQDKQNVRTMSLKYTKNFNAPKKSKYSLIN